MTIIITGKFKEGEYTEQAFFSWLNIGLRQAMEDGFEIHVEE